MRDDLSVFGCPASGVEEAGGSAHITGKDLVVSLDMEKGCISWTDGQGTVFARDLAERAYAYDRAGTKIFHYMVRQPGEHYYGFGERAGPLNKKGLRMEMRNLDALGYDASETDPLYKHWPIYITWNPLTGIAYALIYDNLADTVFDMGKEIDAYHGDYRAYQAAGGDLDYYLVYGPGLADVVRRISLLIGRIQLPPRWALGYMGSGMGYTDSPDVVSRLGDFVKECATYNIPCDMFHLSSGYSMSNTGERWVFSWNRDRIPEPPVIARNFHNGGMKVCANIKPCLLQSHPEYEQAARHGVFLQDENGPHLSKFWGGNGSYIDFTSDNGYRWWQEHVKTRILENGIDSTWNDNNEYEVWDDGIMVEGFGRPMPNYLVRPVHSLLMTRASYEAQKEYAPGLRPFALSRSGCPGIQRYAQSWSGDNSTSWESMRYNIPMGLGLSLTGQPNIGHDVGGFYGDASSPELFVRWVQNGIFHPRFSIHSWRTDGTASEPWMYPEVLDIVRSAIELRYAMIPYLYSLFCDAAESGAPIVRPMVYEFPLDPRCTDESFDFMLGPGLLVASVFGEVERTRAVYLPLGARWCDYHTGKWYEGGQEVEIAAPLERPSMLARAGAVIPLGKVMRFVDSEPDDYRALYIFPEPGYGSGSFRLMEDDGKTNAYLEGERTVLEILVSSSPDTIEIRIAWIQSGYALPYTHLHVMLPPGETRPVKSAGVIEPHVDGDHGRIYVLELTKET
jgi:alpha-glucosidase